MRECVWGCWLSVLTSHHSTEADNNLAMALFAITAFLFARHIPSPLLLVMCFTCPNPTPALPFTEQLVLRLEALPPPLATLAPQHVLIVYIISVCCVADLGTCYVVCFATVA